MRWFIFCLRSSWHSVNSSDLIRYTWDFSTKKTSVQSTAELRGAVRLIHLNWATLIKSDLFLEGDLVHDGRKGLLLTGSVTYCRWTKMWITLLMWILRVMSFTKGLDNARNLQHSREYRNVTCHSLLCDMFRLAACVFTPGDRHYIWRQ